MEGKDLEREIGFIARHYRQGLFNTKKALRKIRPTIRKIWSWQRIAAASCILIVVGATAALLIRNSFNSERPTEIEKTITPPLPAKSISKMIDFEDAPLSVVIDQISVVYDVEITNIPADAEEYRLTLHYEGNANDLIETINDILGTNLEIEK